MGFLHRRKGGGGGEERNEWQMETERTLTLIKLLGTLSL